MPRDYWFHCIEEACDYREKHYRNVKVCPNCGSYLVREEPPGPVILGHPREYPEKPPEVSGYYLIQVVLDGTRWLKYWFDRGIGFGIWDKHTTHWLPMPPNISTADCKLGKKKAILLRGEK